MSELKRIYGLAERILVEAATLNKSEGRHPISDAATLICWLVALVDDPDDEESNKAARDLLDALPVGVERMKTVRRKVIARDDG